MSIRVGCAAWLFTEPAHNPPYEEAIAKIGKIGFDGVELILRDFHDIGPDGYWTKEKIAEIKKMLDDLHLEVSQFAVFQNITEGLASIVPAERQKAIDYFRHGCDICAGLGGHIMNFVSPWPWEITSPNDYLPEYYYINVPGVDPRLRALNTFQTKMKYSFPKPFDWQKYWDNHVDAITRVADIANEYGFILAIENHANTMTPHTDSLLRLFDEVNRDNLGANLDTVWAYLQREYLPWSVHKYGNKLFNVHMRDGDGLAAYNLPVGFGNIDWEEFIRALYAINYDGFLSLEWSHDSRAEENAANVLAYLRNLISEVGKEFCAEVSR